MKTRVHELLGVEPREEFEIEGCVDGTIFIVTEEGFLVWKNKKEGFPSWTGKNCGDFMCMLINCERKIIRRPALTEEQREVLVWLHKGGFTWVALEEDGEIAMFEEKPTRGTCFPWMANGGNGYCKKLACLRPIIPDWKTALDIAATLRDAGVGV